MKTYNLIDKDSSFVGVVSAETEEEALEIFENININRVYVEEVEEFE